MRAGWHETSLANVCDVVNGGTPKTGVAANWGGPHMWITPAEMGRRADPHVGETRRQLTDMGLAAANLLPPYSVILSSRAPIGHLVINSVPMATNQGCKGLVPKPGLDHKYLFYYLGSVVELLNDLGTGTTFKELSGSRLKAAPIPVPPLPEQQRIVAILDEVFSELATATANAEKNLKNARELFDSYLSKVFSEKAEGWEERKLSDLCREVTVGHVGPMAKRYKQSGIPFLRSQNIRPFEVSWDEAVYIDEGFNRELSKSQLHPGDVAIVRTGYPGTAAVIPDALKISNCADLVIIRCGDQLDAGYVTAFFNSSYGKRLVNSNLNGAAQKHFNVTSAKAVKIALPPKSQQKLCVREMQAFRSQCSELEQRYKRKQGRLTDLKQSILQRAFSGELTSPPSRAIKEAAE